MSFKKVVELRQEIIKKGIIDIEVVRYLQVYKYDFELDCINAKTADCWHKCIPNWALVKVQIKAKVINLRYDKFYKNILFVTRYGPVYLNFIDTCKRGYR